MSSGLLGTGASATGAAHGAPSTAVPRRRRAVCQPVTHSGPLDHDAVSMAEDADAWSMHVIATRGARCWMQMSLGRLDTGALATVDPGESAAGKRGGSLLLAQQRRIHTHTHTWEEMINACAVCLLSFVLL